MVCDAGEEHRVWIPGDQTRHFKATRPGRCGFYVVSGEERGFQAELTGALPLEYLERLEFQNGIFGDRIHLEGVADEAGQLVVITSQPTMVGSPISDDEMLGFMRKLWFQPLTGLALGRPGSLSFYRDLDEVAAFDAHPGNFVKDDNGVVLPIDLVLVRDDAALQAAFAPFLHS